MLVRAQSPATRAVCLPVQVISQLMERSEEATQQARELASEAESLQVRTRETAPLMLFLQPTDVLARRCFPCDASFLTCQFLYLILRLRFLPTPSKLHHYYHAALVCVMWRSC